MVPAGLLQGARLGVARASSLRKAAFLYFRKGVCPNVCRYVNGHRGPASRFTIDDGRTLLEIPEDALDLFEGTAEVFGDLGRQHVRVR